MFALRQVLTLCEAELIEPDVACSSVNFKGPQVQEAAFNSQMLELAKMMLSLFKRGEALGPKRGPPRATERNICSDGTPSLCFLVSTISV